MAGPRKPPGSDWDPTLDDAEIFVETPTAPSGVGPLPESDDENDSVALDDVFRDEDTELGIDQGIPTIAEPLPEMYPDMWQAGIQAVVTVTDDAPTAWPPAEEWAVEARRYRTESALTEDPVVAAQLLLAAARALEQAGDIDQAERVCDEALQHDPSAPEALRVRARLAERRGDFDDAHALWARMATAINNADERAFYGGLTAEWTLARGGKLPPVARQAIPAGPARALAQAEEALRAGGPGDVANALADAGRAMGGALGAALLDHAGRCREAARDRLAAVGERVEAAKLDPYAPPSLPARLRDAARADERKALPLIDDLAAGPGPESVLSTALARWRAGLAAKAGDKARAAALREGLAPVTAAAARDRIDQEAASGAPLDPASLERLRGAITGAAGTVVLNWIEAGNLARRGEPAAALALMGRVIAENADAIPLGLLAQQIAADVKEPGEQATALDLWLRSDPGRRAEAALALAAAREAASGGADPLAGRAALQTAIEAAPGSALFWSVAASDARAGRQADAAATLAYGAEMWGPSALAPGLRVCALSHLALGEPEKAFESLQAKLAESPDAPVTHPFELEARARLAERAGDAGALLSMLTAAAAGADPHRAASLAPRRAELVDLTVDSKARARVLERALADVPDDPVVLPLLLLDAAVAPAAAGQALWRAGDVAAASAAPIARLYRLAASETAALDTDDRASIARASELVAALPADRLARRALVRAAERLGAAERAEAIAERIANSADSSQTTTAAVDEADAGLALVVAEALAARDDSRAPAAYRALVGGRFAADARRGLARLARAHEPGAEQAGQDDAQGLPPGLLAGPVDAAAAAASTAVTDVFDAARGGNWDDAVASLRDSPPHEGAAGPATLHAAALLAEGRGSAAAAAALEAAALAAAGGDPDAVSVSTLARIAEGDGKPELRVAALELAAARFTHDQAKLALAVVDSMRARLADDAGDRASATEHWRAALAVDPSCLPAAQAIRRDAARRGDLAMAVDATEAEAACLGVPEHRVHTLLLAAALAEEAARGEEGGVPHRRRAIALLRAVLAIDPGHEAAFEQLRTLLSEAGDTTALSEALASRIAVAANPFEVTSLRLARAELQSGGLADRAGARAELDAILHKQPEHPRALARLSDLLWDEQAWSEAGEIYLRRTAVERDPAALRESFLRLGHIYRERVPDAHRAIAAYERVRGIEADNRDALRALSELYMEEGDTKQALPVTERLVATEPDAKKRTAYRVRLGELLMRAGDLRRAGTELRRAVDGDPRNVAAVTALAQLLDRSRDAAGRRALLDHAVGLLRHDVERGELSIESLRALVALLLLREKPRAAAAVSDLVAVLIAAPGTKPDRPARPGRSLAALRRPEIDERSFPPGLPPGIRQLMRIVGPHMRPGGSELAQALGRQGVSRAERAGRGEGPRPLFDGVAAELGAGDFELFIKPAGAAGAVALRAEPGSPAGIVVGAPIVAMGPGAVRFAAARTLRLAGTNLDALLAVPTEEAAALLVGIIRQFVPDFLHAAVRDALVDAEAARAARLIPRRVKPAASAFAIESAGPFDVVALHAAVRDGANAAGLLASADLPAALSVILAASGTREPTLTLSPIAAQPEALALLRFAVSDAYDDLAAAMEG
ncbi:MAG TPA: tetratricopeptide repeat protein [Polyangia bacterium]|nr:tetratricopeptide repeat protein [Polyangia bacterium]